MAPPSFQNAAQMKTDERERLHLSRTYDAHLPMVKDASSKLQVVMKLGSGIWVAGHSILPPWEMPRPGPVQNETVRKQVGSQAAALPRNKLDVFSDASRPHSQGSMEKTMHRRKLEQQPTYVHSSPTQYPQPPVTQPSSRPALSSKDTNTALKHHYGDGSFKPDAFVTTQAPAPALSSSKHLKRKLHRSSVEFEEHGRMSKLPKVVIDLTVSPDQPQSFNRPVTSGESESQYQAQHGNVYPDQFNLSSHFPVFSRLGVDDTPDNEASLPNNQGGDEETFYSYQVLSAQAPNYIPLVDESPQSVTNAPIPDINPILSTFPAFHTAGPHLPPIILPLFFDDDPFYAPQPLRSPFKPKNCKFPPVSHHEDEEEFGKHAHMDRALAHRGEEDDFQLPPSYLKYSGLAPVPGSDDEEEFGRHAHMDRALARRGEDENSEPRHYLKHSKLTPISAYDDNENEAYINMHKNNAYMNNMYVGAHGDFPITHLNTGAHGQHASNDSGDAESHAYVDDFFVDAFEEEGGCLDTDTDEDEAYVCCTATHCCVCAQDIITCGGHCKCPCYDIVERHAHLDRVLAGDYKEEDYPSEEDEYPSEDEEPRSQEEPTTKELTEAERNAYIDRVFAGAPEDFPIDDLDTEAQEEEAGKHFDEVYDSAYESAIAEDFEAAGKEFDDVYDGRALPYFLASDAEHHVYDDDEEDAEGRSGAFEQHVMHNTTEDALPEPHSPAPQDSASGRDADGYWDGIDIFSPAADYVDDEY